MARINWCLIFTLVLESELYGAKLTKFYLWRTTSSTLKAYRQMKFARDVVWIHDLEKTWRKNHLLISDSLYMTILVIWYAGTFMPDELRIHLSAYLQTYSWSEWTFFFNYKNIIKKMADDKFWTILHSLFQDIFTDYYCFMKLSNIMGAFVKGVYGLFFRKEGVHISWFSFAGM